MSGGGTQRTAYSMYWHLPRHGRAGVAHVRYEAVGLGREAENAPARLWQ